MFSSDVPPIDIISGTQCPLPAHGWCRASQIFSCTLAVSVLLASVISSSVNAFAADKPVFHSGRRLDTELGKPVSMLLTRTPVRDIVQRVRNIHGIGLLLDRRIDPDRSLDVQFVQMSLHESLQLLALQLDGAFVQIGSTPFIGPPAETDRAQTLIVLRTAEVRKLKGPQAVNRKQELLGRMTLHWERLTEPAAIIEQIVAQAGLRIEGQEFIPHDLWGAGQLVNVNAVEALTLLLGEFDLMFEWQTGGDAIRILPAPSRVTMSQSHASRTMTSKEATEVIQREWPHLTPTPSSTPTSRQLVLEATVKEHADIAALLNPPSTKDTPATTSQGPLRNRRFTITATRAEAIAILRTLETQEVIVEYDRAVLRVAGIDLRKKVTVVLKQATADELFSAICDPLGLQFEIDDKTVRLSPK